MYNATWTVGGSENFNNLDDEFSWWVDFGATAHGCRDKEMFKSFCRYK
ncbi:unnamed protein product [Rhodiola kirilowii]